MKKISFAFFVGNAISGIGVSHFGQGYRALGPNLTSEEFRSISVETRLNSESFEPSFGFLGFMVQKLQPKN